LKRGVDSWREGKRGSTKRERGKKSNYSFQPRLGSFRNFPPIKKGEKGLKPLFPPTPSISPFPGEEG
jgi:hypothetical protein